MDQATPALTRASVPRRSPNASWRDVGGEVVILDTSGRVLRGLNGTGGVAWQLADGARSVEEIAREIARQTRADDERVLADVLRFFEQLAAVGLVAPAGHR